MKGLVNNGYLGPGPDLPFGPETSGDQIRKGQTLHSNRTGVERTYLSHVSKGLYGARNPSKENEIKRQSGPSLPLHPSVTPPPTRWTTLQPLIKDTSPVPTPTPTLCTFSLYMKCQTRTRLDKYYFCKPN